MDDTGRSHWCATQRINPLITQTAGGSEHTTSDSDVLSALYRGVYPSPAGCPGGARITWQSTEMVELRGFVVVDWPQLGGKGTCLLLELS